MCARRRKPRERSSPVARASKQRRASSSASEQKGFTSAVSSTKQKGVKEAPGKAVRGWRLWLFRAAAITVIPALFFLSVEFILRVAGYGYPPAATIKSKVNGTAVYGDNVKFAWRFFPREIARDFEPFIFPADKGQRTCRIFILGSSAAQGIPDAAFNFGRILRVMLQERYAGVHFEVITVAMAAINSHVVLQVAKDCARHQADVYVVYLGNNEVTGPYGAGTVFAPLSSSLFLIRTSIAMKTSRLGQLLTNLNEWAGARRDIPEVWAGMEMFLEKQVSEDDPSLHKVYQHYRANLQDISRAARASGAKIILCTVASNVKDCPPFGSLHRPGLNDNDRQKWEDIYQQGVAYEIAGDSGRAVERYLTAAQIDDCYADLQFRLGRCYWNLGEYDQAKDRYIRARELDTLRFRADNRINQIIREVAGSGAAEGVYLADAVRAFEANSPAGAVGEELFYEHVHLNFKGNYLLAKTVLEQLEQALPQWASACRVPERPLVSEQQCVERLAYTDWDRYKIADEVLTGFIRHAPFTNQLFHEEQVRRLEEKVKELGANLTADGLEQSASQYRSAIAHDSKDWVLHWKYGKLLAEDLKDYSSAAEQYRLVQKLIPHSYLGYNALGSVLCALWDLDGAIGQHLKAIRIRPTCSDAHYHLGWAYEKKGEINEAIKHYAQAARWQRQRVPAYNNLAEILAKQGQLDKAIEVCRQGLRYCPNSAILHCNLGTLFAKQGRRDQALMEIQTALEIDPNSAMIRRILEAVSGKAD